MADCLSALCDHVEDHHLFHRSLLARLRDPALRELCDLDVYVDGKCFSCHRAVLCGASDVLRCMLTGSWFDHGKERVDISFVTPSAFDTLLEFVYTGRLSPSAETVVDLYRATKLLLVDALEDMVRSRVLLHISAATVFAIGEQAYLFDDFDVQEACENFIVEHFEAVSKTTAFLHQPQDCIVHFLASDRLFLPGGEAQVAAAVLGWVLFRPSERVDSLPHLLKYVRFPEMTEAELQAVLKLVPADSSVFDEIRLCLERVSDEEDSRVLEHAAVSLDREQEMCEPATTLLLGPAAPNAACSRPNRRHRNRHAADETSGPRFRIGRRCVRNIRFDFVLRNFSQYHRGADAVNSPWHKCGGGLLWRLEIYPRGPSIEQDEYLSVFLRCCDESSTDSFSALVNFSLYIVEQNFGGQAVVFRANKTFTQDEACWGKSKYIKLNDLTSADQALRDITTDSVVIGASITW